jgi:gamma-glutamyltranspeptidase/glutathione hydrolase
MVASTQWLGSAAGMAVLEFGGNAFDAAVATGLVLQVVQPHLNGPAGDLPIIFWAADRGEPLVICGQGPAPAAATVQKYHELGHELVPGTGLLAACVPGAFDAWMVLLRDFGTMRLAEVAEYAIGYAESGYPAAPRFCSIVREVEEQLRSWPASMALYLPPPHPGRRFANPELAAVYRRLVREARGGSREDEIERAREVWSRGFVAEAIERFSVANGGLLTADDLARWSATIEQPLSCDFRGTTVCKAGPWTQGPVFLQQLMLLDGFDLEAMGLNTPEYVHVVIECAKLAFADREAFYGDPTFAEVPLDRLLSGHYAHERRRLVTEEASIAMRPGGGRLPRLHTSAVAAAGTGEPPVGDTVHLDVADRFGNVVAATPSGGWLQSSPVVPGLGFPLGTRAQAFWLDEDHPNGLAPGKRPRTTLSPSLALRNGEPYLAFGTPGGDHQDQWSLTFFLAHTVFGLNLQAAIDAPCFHTEHIPDSFYPRHAKPNVVEIEARVGEPTLTGLRARGHVVEVADPWSLGRVSAAGRERDGILTAAANAREMQGYAVGR